MNGKSFLFVNRSGQKLAGIFHLHISHIPPAYFTYFICIFHIYRIFHLHISHISHISPAYFTYFAYFTCIFHIFIAYYCILLHIIAYYCIFHMHISHHDFPPIFNFLPLSVQPRARIKNSPRPRRTFSERNTITMGGCGRPNHPF